MSGKDNFEKDSLLEVFLFEATQLIEQAENFAMQIEREKLLTQEEVNEIFRIMHTIKGSASMMMYKDIAELAHNIEELFSLIRDNKIICSDYSKISDILLSAVDFVKAEIEKISSGGQPDADPEAIILQVKGFIEDSKKADGEKGKETEAKENARAQASQDAPKGAETAGNLKAYNATVLFEEDCQMENIRAFSVIKNLEKIAREIVAEPSDLDSEEGISAIREKGLVLRFKTDKSEAELKAFFEGIIMLKEYSLKEEAEPVGQEPAPAAGEENSKRHINAGKANTDHSKQSLISVNTNKLDTLMDMVGEMVILEAMLDKSPDLAGLNLENFSKLTMQLKKLTDELKDVVMSLRLVPVSSVFMRMQRIVRDMNKSLGKNVRLVLEGEDTEVDKSIIENISDPLMHLVRNSMDHGIEQESVRKKAGKPAQGTIKLSAVNTGENVYIVIEDDGKGIDRDSVLKKAQKKKLLKKPASEMTDREVYDLLFLPGFSTKEEVTEYSGRGVGMDVVKKNIEKVDGNVYIDSKKGQGTKTTIKIPLTLAIIDGMGVKIGDSMFTIPINSIREFFRPEKKDIITDKYQNEMIMLRGECYPVVRMYRYFNIEPKTRDLEQGIFVVVENNGKTVCLFVDELIGEQQVVVKPLPKYFMQSAIKSKGVSGCTILGDGALSFIINVASLIDNII